MRPIAALTAVLFLAGFAPAGEFTVTSNVPVAFKVETKLPSLPTDPNIPAPAGFQWVKRGDNPWKLEKAAPAVAAPIPFRGAAFDRSHTCAKCGREQRVVAGFNADNTHTHVCGNCGHSWKH